METAEIDITFEEAFQKICDDISIPYGNKIVILSKYHKENNTGKDAIYAYENIGNSIKPVYTYTLITTDKSAIYVYKSLDNIWNYYKKKFLKENLA